MAWGGCFEHSLSFALMMPIEVEVCALGAGCPQAVMLVDGEDYAGDCIDLIAAALSAIPSSAVLVLGTRGDETQWIGPAADYPEGLIDVDSCAINFDELLDYDELELVLSEEHGWRCMMTLNLDVDLQPWDRLPQVVSRTGLWDPETNSNVVSAALRWEAAENLELLKEEISPELLIPALEFLASLPEDPDTAADADLRMKLVFALQLGYLPAELLAEVPNIVSHATLCSVYVVARYLEQENGPLAVLEDGSIDPDSVLAILKFDQLADQFITIAAPNSAAECMEEFDSFIADIEAMWDIGYLELREGHLELTERALELWEQGEAHGLAELVFVSAFVER